VAGTEKISYDKETLDDLILGGMKIFQAREGYRFSIDAVLLAHFPEVTKVKQVIDLGSGNGIIPLLLAWRSPEVKITGIEVQSQMVNRSIRSVQYNNLEEKIEFINADLKDIKKIFAAGLFDLVLSNPPFWKNKTGHLSKNQEQAIARHELMANLNDIINAAAYCLRPGGKLCLIHHSSRFIEVLQSMQKYKLAPARIRMVHSYLGQEAKLVLIEGQKNGPGNISFEPPLIIYDKPGEYSKEIRQMYNST